MPYVEFSFKVNQIKDTAFIAVQHMWIAPDPIKNNPNNAKLSNSHYWIVDGLLPETFKASATLEYKNNATNTFLDADLVSVTEDSLILVYRKSPKEDWRKFPYYSKQMLSATDGQGFLKIDTLLMGEYAFANGSLPTVATTEKNQITARLTLYPNPVNSLLHINSATLSHGNKILQVYHTNGLLAFEKTVFFDGEPIQLSTESLTNGQYYVQISKNGMLEGSASFMIQR